MKNIKSQLACFWLKLTHKIYQVKYSTYGKNIHIRYVAVRRTEQFDADAIVKALAAELRLKPESIHVQSINRARW